MVSFLLGSVELRADGTFYEWIIQNQSPAGAAKIPARPDLFFGVRLGPKKGDSDAQAFVLQTHPDPNILKVL